MLWLAIFLAIPLVRVVGMSVWDDGLTVKFYGKVFHDLSFYRTLWVTIKISVLTTGCCLLIGYPVAHLIATARQSLSNAVATIVMLSFWTSLLVRTYAWMV